MKKMTNRKPVLIWLVVILLLSNFLLMLYLIAELYFIVKPENNLLRNKLQIQKTVVNFLVRSSSNNVENLDIVIKNTKYMNLQGEEITFQNEITQNTFMFFVPKDVCPTCYDLSFLKRIAGTTSIVIIVPINMAFDLRETLEFYKIYPKYFVYRELYKERGLSTIFFDPCLFIWQIRNAKSEKVLFVPKQFNEELIGYYLQSISSHNDALINLYEIKTP